MESSTSDNHPISASAPSTLLPTPPNTIQTSSSANLSIDSHMRAETSSSHADLADTSMPDATLLAADPTPVTVTPRLAPTGSQPRVYLNSKVTPHLMEAMKSIALHQPEKPLKWLSEFLAARSEEVEG